MKISHILISFFLFITNDVISSERPPIDFTSSNLPILVITTSGQTIIDDVKITAHMGVIFNGDGKINNITDPYNDYDGYIGIEIRGYSSSGWSEKKPYGIETRDALGENNNVSLLGLPKENDWVLYAPIADKSLMRNKLVYDLASEMGQYAPRTKFCEVVIDGDYRGVYVLT